MHVSYSYIFFIFLYHRQLRRQSVSSLHLDVDISITPACHSKAGEKNLIIADLDPTLPQTPLVENYKADPACTSCRVHFHPFFAKDASIDIEDKQKARLHLVDSSTANQ